MPVQIQLNGEKKAVSAVTVAELLKELDLPHQKVAVEKNREVVSRLSFEEERLADGDVVEVVQFVGGG